MFEPITLTADLDVNGADILIDQDKIIDITGNDPGKNYLRFVSSSQFVELVSNVTGGEVHLRASNSGGNIHSKIGSVTILFVDADGLRIDDTKSIRTGFAVLDNDYFTIQAHDNDDANGTFVEVARAGSAIDPFFSLGGSQEHKFTNAGLLGLYSVAPVAQPADAGQADQGAMTSSVIGDTGSTNGGWGASSEVNADKIFTAVDQLVSDVAALDVLLTEMRTALVNTGIMKGAA